MNDFVLNLAPTGMIPTKLTVAAVPLQPNEVIAEVKAARKFGIGIVHVHARDENGDPTWRGDIYRRIVEGIRGIDPDLVICVSTSGRTWSELERRSECLLLDGDAKPDMASLTLSSLNFAAQASLNSPTIIQDLAAIMKERAIKPELEVFDLGMMNYAKYLIKKGLLDPPFYFNIILGNIAGAQDTPLALGMLLSELPEGSIWSGGGIGLAQLRANVMALVNGGGVRVGLEDNIYWDAQRNRTTTNSELLERIVDLAAKMGCRPASPRRVRELLGIRQTPAVVS